MGGVSFSPSLSHTLSLSLSLSLPLSLSLSLYLSFIGGSLSISLYLSLSLSISTHFCLAHSLSLSLSQSSQPSCSFFMLCIPLFLSHFESVYLLCFSCSLFTLSIPIFSSASSLKALYLCLPENLTKRKCFHNKCLYQRGGTTNKMHSTQTSSHRKVLRGTLRMTLSQKRRTCKKGLYRWRFTRKTIKAVQTRILCKNKQSPSIVTD